MGLNFGQEGHEIKGLESGAEESGAGERFSWFRPPIARPSGPFRNHENRSPAPFAA
jgi:hypothetical protein